MARMVVLDGHRLRRQRALPPETTADADLLRRMQAGDQTAIATAIERHGVELLTYLAGRLRDRQQAEEVWQDVWLRLWQAAPGIRDTGHLRGWLFRVARNAAVDEIRRRTHWDLVVLAEEAVDADPRHDPAAAVEAGWRHSTIAAAVARLPVAYREAIRLRYWHMLTLAETAATLGIPAGTVKSRLNYAYRRLAKMLRDADGGLVAAAARR